MNQPRNFRNFITSDLGLLVLLALIKLVIHLLTNGQYGFHRDELGMLDDARHLAWGYVSYPPLTAILMRIGWDLFGLNLAWLRLFPALAQSIAMLLAGLIAGELGGGRKAQVFAALAVAVSTVSLAWSTLFQYGAFDYLWWVAICYLMVKLVTCENPRYWLGIGVFIGLGMLTKYSMGFYVVGLAAGVLLTGRARWLKSPWLWAGAGVSLLIFLPNLVWLVQNHFIHLDFLASIHARDIRMGRTQTFLLDQLYLPANPFTIPLWVAGLFYFFRSEAGKRYRILGWMAVIPFTIYIITQGRGYYTGPLFPVLLAGGAVYAESWLATLKPQSASRIEATAWRILAAGGFFLAAVVLPLAPVGSAWWDFARVPYNEPAEEIGWPELVQAVAQAYDSVPQAEKASTAILSSYAEGGAINLYGPAYGLPPIIGFANTDWLRGYGDPPPQTLVVVGADRPSVDQFFSSCTVAATVANPTGVDNEIARDHPLIFVCRGLKLPWPQFWEQIRTYS
jgi:hypothetical protein